MAADSPPPPPSDEDDAATRKKGARLERARAWAASRKQDAGAEEAHETVDNGKSKAEDGDLLLDLEAEERDQQRLDAWQGDEERIRIG